MSLVCRPATTRGSSTGGLSRPGRVRRTSAGAVSASRSPPGNSPAGGGLRPARRAKTRDDARNTGIKIVGAGLPGTAPSPADITAVQRRLRASQGAFVPKPVLPIIDEIVATVLSQHTSDVNSERAFAQLKDRFPTWEQVADAPVAQVAEAIRSGGIANQKARRVQQIL